MRRSFVHLMTGLVTILIGCCSASAAEKPSKKKEPETKAASPKSNSRPIAAVRQKKPVDFEKQILPIFQASCLACHSESEAEADLVLETPEAILKGGESGPAVVPNKSSSSLLLQVAAHQKKPIMPPPRNKASAPDLTPEQLGLIKLWIDQGAKGSVQKLEPVAWQALPENLHMIEAVSLTADGDWAAAAHGNRLLVYDVRFREMAAEIIDPTFTVAHRDLVQSLAFSDDGQWLASGSFREVKLWKRHWGAMEQRASLPDMKMPAKVQPLPEGKGVLWQMDKKISWREIPSGKEVRSWEIDGEILQAVPGRDLKTIVVLTRNSEVLLFNREQEKPTTRGSVAHAPTHAITGEEGFLVTGHADGMVRRWQWKEGAWVNEKEFKAHEGKITALHALPKGQWATAGADAKIKIWENAEGKILREIAHEGPVENLAVSLDGMRGLSWATAPGARLWNLTNGVMVRELKGERMAQEWAASRQRIWEVQNMHVNFWKSSLEAGQKELAAQTDRTKKATEAKSVADKAFADSEKKHQPLAEAVTAAEKALEEIPAESADAKKAGMEKVTAAKKALEPVSKELEKARLVKKNADQEHELALQAVQKAESTIAKAKEELAQAETHLKKADQENQEAKAADKKKEAVVSFAVFTADGREVLVQAADQTWRHFRSEDGVALKAPPEIPETAPRWTHDQEIFWLTDKALVSRKKVPEWKWVRTWGEESKAGLVDRVNAVAFNRGGNRLAMGSGEPSRSGQILVAEVESGKILHHWKRVHIDSVLGLQFSPDDRYLASASADKFVRVVDVDSGKVIKAFEGHTHYVFGVSWRRDGRMLASAGGDNVVKTWDFMTGERKVNVGGFGKQITSVHYLENLDQILATSGDTQVRLVNESGNEVRKLNGAKDYVYASAISPDGTLVVAGGHDGVLRLWNALTGDLLKEFEPQRARAVKSTKQRTAGSER